MNISTLTVVAHEYQHLETPEPRPEEPHRTAFEPAQHRVLPFHTQFFERAPEARQRRPPQETEIDPKLPPHRRRPLEQRLVDETEETAHPRSIEVRGLGNDAAREHPKSLSLFLGK